MQFHGLSSLMTAACALQVVMSQNITPEEFCKRVGPSYNPTYEADGSFSGRCDVNDGRICLGTEYTIPSGAVICCMGDTVMAVDSATNEAACCPPGNVYKNRACADPSTTPECPSWNARIINKNGVNFQIWCQRNIIEYVNPFDFGAKFSAVMNMNMRGTATFQDCLDACAADPRCQGANWWHGKGLCGFNNKQQGGGWFNQGGDYRNPPQVAWMDRNVISMVAVPQR